MEMLLEDIETGKIDPLEWIKERSRNVVVPEGALYDPDCSRFLSVTSFSPRAAFHMGRDFPEALKLFLGTNWADPRSRNRLMENPGFKEMNKQHGKIRAFYRGKRFEVRFSDELSSKLRDPDGMIEGEIWLFGIKDMLGVKDHTCHSMPAGPSIMLYLTRDAFQRYLDSRN